MDDPDVRRRMMERFEATMPGKSSGIWERTLAGVRANQTLPVWTPVGRNAAWPFDDSAAAELADALRGTWRVTELCFAMSQHLTDASLDTVVEVLPTCSVSGISLDRCTGVSEACRSRALAQVAKNAARLLAENAEEITRIYWPDIKPTRNREGVDRPYADAAMFELIVNALPGNTRCRLLDIGAVASTPDGLAQLELVLPKCGVCNLRLGGVDGALPGKLRTLLAQNFSRLIAEDEESLSEIDWYGEQHDEECFEALLEALSENSHCKLLRINSAAALCGDQLHERLVEAIGASDLQVVRFEREFSTDGIASGWSEAKELEVCSAALENTLRLVSDNNGYTEQVDWSGCALVDEAALTRLADAIKSNGSVRRISLENAGAELELSDDDDHKDHEDWWCLFNGLRLLDSALDTTNVRSVNLEGFAGDYDRGWWDEENAMFRKRCQRNILRERVADESTQANRPLQRLLLCVLHARGPDTAQPLVHSQISLSADLMEKIAEQLRYTSSLPIDTSASAMKRNLFWPDEPQETPLWRLDRTQPGEAFDPESAPPGLGEPIRAVEFAWHSAHKAEQDRRKAAKKKEKNRKKKAARQRKKKEQTTTAAAVTADQPSPCPEATDEEEQTVNGTAIDTALSADSQRLQSVVAKCELLGSFDQLLAMNYDCEICAKADDDDWDDVGMSVEDGRKLRAAMRQEMGLQASSVPEERLEP